MLHTETVSLGTLELLKSLMQDERMAQFVLVGGTSLSLQLGHRISVDLDLFSAAPFDEIELSSYLVSNYGLELDFISRCTIKGEIQGVQIDCIAHQYPWIGQFLEKNGIRLANIIDIAAMKLNAIAGNGTRIKDFIDIAYLASYLSFEEMLHAYEQKYKANSVIPLKAITYWDDINFSEPIRMLDASTFRWQKIEKRLREMQRFPSKKIT